MSAFCPGTFAGLTGAEFHRQFREDEIMPDERELVHSFERSATEQVQVSLSKYKGKTYADIRIYYKADDGEYRPTKKGITVSPAQLPELGEAIRKLIEMVEGTE
jgi:hypothetical protein